MVSKAQIITILKSIPDPELGVSIWDLGLIYHIDIDAKSGIVTVRMTLTSIGCPLFNVISDPIKESVKSLPGVKDVQVELTFEPAWSVELMSKAAKIQLGMQ